MEAGDYDSARMTLKLLTKLKPCRGPSLPFPWLCCVMFLQCPLFIKASTAADSNRICLQAS